MLGEEKTHIKEPGMTEEHEDSKQNALMKEIRKTNNRLTEQDQKINKLTNIETTKHVNAWPKAKPMTNDEATPTLAQEPWIEVKNNQKKTTHTVRKKAPAVMVKTGNLSYVDVLKKIRTEPSLEEFTEDIMSMRKTIAGHLLVELKINSKNVEQVNSAIRSAVGKTETVSTLSQTVKIGVFGLDELTSQQEFINKRSSRQE